MDMPFNRRDIGYTIIARFEEAYRLFLSEKLTVFFANYLDGIPPAVLDKAKDRLTKDKWDSANDCLEETDFSDLKDITLYKNMYAKYFPSLAISTTDFSEIIDELYDLRCKISHVRNYFTSLDLDKLLDLSKKIASHFESSKEDFYEFLRIMQEHPEDVVIPTPAEFICNYDYMHVIPNNIPIPDYEYEGGFIGRQDYIKKLMKELEGELHRVVTISGAGGVGKTALALRVIQKILQKSGDNFDGLIWLSAKETKLSYLGIEELEPSLKTYEQLLDTIYNVMGFGDLEPHSVEKKEAEVNTIFDLYNRILIVIDNLETLTDQRIINFILDAHPKIKILVTSRKGLGQVERRYDLKQLKEDEAVYLFRQIAKDKQIDSLAKLDDNIIKIYANKVSCYPLAIKWVIGQVARGKDINAVIDSIHESTSDISHFCFDQIYKGLSKSAKNILCALCYFDEQTSAGVLNYVVNLRQEDFEDGISELILVSFIIPEQYKTEQNEIARRYTILPLTRGYVIQQLSKDTILKREIEERLQTVNRVIEEEGRAKKQYRFALSTLGAVTEEDKVAAMIATTAFQKYEAGKYAEAVEDYKRASEIAPRFASIYRNWAVMESNEGHPIEADNLMSRAVKLSDKDPLIWLTWGNIKKKSEKIKEAHEYFERAYRLSPDNPFVISGLGQAKSRLGQYAEADKLYKDILSNQTNVLISRQEVILRSGLADNLKRWYENLNTTRNHKESQKKLEEALEECERIVQLDKGDIKSLDLRREVLISLGYFYKNMSRPDDALICFLKSIVNKPERYREAKDTGIAGLEAGKLFYSKGHVDKANEICSFLNKKLRLKGDPDLLNKIKVFCNEISSTDIMRGKIISVNPERYFTIIESLTSPGETYLGHADNFVPKIDDFNENLMGKTVSFVPKEEEKYQAIKKTARLIRILSTID